MRWKTLVFGVVAVLLAGLPGMTLAQGAPVTVRFGTIYQTHSASTFDPIYPDAARKYGLNVQIIPFQRYADIQIALATGRLDAGAFGYANIPLMAEQNVRNVQIIAGQSVGAEGVTLRKGVNGRTWKDLEGLRMGVAPNSNADNEVKVALSLDKVDSGKIHWITFSTMGPEVLQALKTGAIDGFVGWEPAQATAAVNGYGAYAPFRLDDTPLKNINGVIGANTDFLARHPEAAMALLRALVETTDYLNAHKDQWAALASAKTGTSLEVTKTAIAHSILTYNMYRQPASQAARPFDVSIRPDEDRPYAAGGYLHELSVSGESDRQNEAGARWLDRHGRSGQARPAAGSLRQWLSCSCGKPACASAPWTHGSSRLPAR